jgi:hypothetical protein
MEGDSMGQRIFISHSTTDLAAARQLCDALESAGFSCWIAPRDIPLGASYPSAIAKAIAESDALAVVISDDANASRQGAREVTHAMETSRLLFPICISKAQPQGDLAYLLAGIERYDAEAATRAAFDDVIPRLRLAFYEGQMPLRAPSPGPSVAVLEVPRSPAPARAVVDGVTAGTPVPSDRMVETLGRADAARKGVVIAGSTVVLALLAALFAIH